jgi:nucleoside-diphosphate-sugar epimerase
MTALVTGATGFIGSHVVDALWLNEGHVHALVRDPAKAVGLRERGVHVTVGDMRDRSVLDAALREVDTVFHCAAAGGEYLSRRELFAHNPEGARQLFDAARSAGAHVILLSGLNVLGLRNLDPAVEDLPRRRSKDASTDVKIAIEELATQAAERYSQRITVLRPGFVYGPRDERNLPRLLQAIRLGKFSYIGSADNVVPIIHVSDVVQAMLLAAATPGTGLRIYHITDGSRTTMGDVAGYLASLIDCPPPQRRVPYALAWLVCVAFDWLRPLRHGRPGPVTRSALFFVGRSRAVDIGRAARELGFAPRVGYREGMAAALRWMEVHSDASLAQPAGGIAADTSP